MVALKEFTSNAGKTVTSPKYGYKLCCPVDRATV